jgi:cobalt/nickel transport system permease protein
MTDYRKLWITLVVLALLAPVGLALPKGFKAGSAWGEWGAEEIRHLIGYIPAGMARTASLWMPPIPDYALPGQQDAPLLRLGVSYLLSGLIGIAVCGGGTYAFIHWLTRGQGRPRE